MLSFTCNCLVGFFFLLVLGMGCVILLWYPLSLPCNYFVELNKVDFLAFPSVFKSAQPAPVLGILKLRYNSTRPRKSAVTCPSGWSFY